MLVSKTFISLLNTFIQSTNSGTDLSHKGNLFYLPLVSRLACVTGEGQRRTDGLTPASNRRPQARTTACLKQACASELVDGEPSNLWDTNQDWSLPFTNYDPKFVERRVVPQTR